MQTVIITSGPILVLRKTHDKARALPKLYRLPIGSLRCFADRFLIVGTLDDVGGCRNMITLTKAINSIVGHARRLFGVDR